MEPEITKLRSMTDHLIMDHSMKGHSIIHEEFLVNNENVLN